VFKKDDLEVNKSFVGNDLNKMKDKEIDRRRNKIMIS